MKKKSERKFKSEIRRASRKHKKNKGFLRLLKHLEKNWDAEIREDKIWNEYNCWSEDIKHMTEQGILHSHNVKEDDTVHKYCKIGANGFQYLYLRKINRWILIATFGGFFIGLLAIAINLFIYYRLI